LPANLASPLTRAPGGNNPINAKAIIVLPLPDSPTNPSDSPAPIRSDTSFTGRTHPAAVGNSTLSPLTSSNFVMTESYARSHNPETFSRKANARELYISMMKKILCPKCGMQAIGPDGFWGTSKPYCSFCGWNVERAREVERASLKQRPRGLLLFGAVFGALAYFAKEKFALLPFLFLSVVMATGAIISWRRLRVMDASHPATAYQIPLFSVAVGEEKTKQARATAYELLGTLSKPRPVRFKTLPRVISIAFPLSAIGAAYFGLLIGRTRFLMSDDYFLLLVGAVIWCVIAILTIRTALGDRRLLAEGELAIAVVTHQKLSGGKHRRSKIHYEFRDAAGRRNQGEATDDSRELYEDMETPVFYNPANPEESVPLVTASCELKQP
jgi:hypothetical protein